MATLNGLTINDTGYIKVSTGTGAQRNLQVFKTVGTSTWTCPTGVTSVEVLVVGGGGGGGNDFGAGGGGGGVVYHPSFSVTPATSYTVTVGGGGAKSTSNNTTASNGGNSVFSTLTANGGGGGASNGSLGAAGGSGGGAAKGNRTSFGTSNQSSFSGATVYGNRGGNASNDPGNGGGAGGGGAGGVGGDAPSASPNAGSNGGTGGAGIQITIGGQASFYGGGGGGGTFIGYTAGSGGTGGGGRGSTRDTRAQDGEPNTGGGGGGAGQAQIQGAGNGGSGIVILSWNSPNSTRGLVRVSTSKGSGAVLETVNSQTRSFDNVKTMGSYEGVVRDSLVLHLDAGDPQSYSHQVNSTTWYDLSGRGNNAAISGEVIFDTASGGCLRYFSTGQGQAQIPSTSDFAFGTGDFTWEAWFQPNTSLATSYNHIMAFPTQGTAALKINVNDGQIYYYDPAFTSYGSVNGWNVALDKWSHVVMTRYNGALYVYLNGLYLGTKASFSTSMSAQICNIGFGQSGENTNKRIAAVRVYRKALSQTEILHNYKVDYQRFGHFDYIPNVPKDNLQSFFDITIPTSYSGYTDYINDLTPLINPTRNSSFAMNPNAGTNATRFGTTSVITDNSAFGGGIQVNNGAIAINSIKDQDFFSASIWLRYNAQNGSESMIINKESVYEWANFTSGGLQFAVFTSNTSWFWQSIGYGNLVAGTLYHFVFQFDGNFVRTYVDGKMIQAYAYSGNSSLANQGSSYTKFGERGGGFSYQGQSVGNYTFYQMMIYDRAISDSEIQQIYEAGYQKFANMRAA